MSCGWPLADRFGSARHPDIPATIPKFLLELHELMPQRSSAAHGALLLIEGNDVPTGVTRSKHRRISLEAL